MESQTASLEEQLQFVIDRLPPSGGVTLEEIRALIGQDSLLLLVVLLALVFMIPVSIPGVSTVFGGAILLIGACRFFNRNLWLPKRISHRMLPADQLRTVLGRGLRWLHRLDRLSRPHRLSWLTSCGPADFVNNGALVIGAVLLMAPFGLVPFSNTLPALALLLLAVGLLQRDGLVVLCGHAFNIATIIYFAVLIAGGSAAGFGVFRHLVGGSP
jgi:hypothetical protein